MLTYSRLACPWSIGAMVNTRSISSSASAAAPSPPRQLPPHHAAPCSRRPRGAAARGQRLAGGRACARRSARRREAVSGGVRSPCRGGRSSCGRPLGREPPRRGRSRQRRPVVKPRRPADVCVQRRRARCGDRCCGEGRRSACSALGASPVHGDILFVPCLIIAGTAWYDVFRPSR